MSRIENNQTKPRHFTKIAFVHNKNPLVVAAVGDCGAGISDSSYSIY